MSAEPQLEKEETQEESEAPKREEVGRERGEHKIRRWFWAAVGVIGVALLTAGANDIYKFTKSLITGDSDGIAPQPIHSRPPVTLTHQLRDPVRDFVGREEETRHSAGGAQRPPARRHCRRRRRRQDPARLFRRQATARRVRGAHRGRYARPRRHAHHARTGHGAGRPDARS